MVFSSITFLFYFLPIFFGIYYFTSYKNLTLLLGSIVFYAWGEPRFVPLLLASATLNYVFGTLVFRAGGRTKWWMLVTGVALNLLVLIYFKYTGFLLSAFNDLIGPHRSPLPVPEILLPLGISFWTFQGISYLIDVYRGVIPAQSSFVNFAMYKAMFPQLIAGPIVRYQQVAREISSRHIGNADVMSGLAQFLVGLAQKVLISNTVAISADRIFGLESAGLSPGLAWWGIVAYSIQIFYDFAGYSNMAIGLGRMLGFQYPINFAQPYSSLSITEFWRRWHISLSSWFRDYLYIPLGGSRVGPWRIYFNLSLVFLLCGLWHGAAWTFVVWGAWHGLLLVIERAGGSNLLARLPSVICRVYTLLAVMLGWVFFRADTVPHAVSYLAVMFGASSGTAAPWQMYVPHTAVVGIVIGAGLALFRRDQWPSAIQQRMLDARWLRALAVPTLAILFMVSVASLAAGTYNPFIYFRF